MTARYQISLNLLNSEPKSFIKLLTEKNLITSYRYLSESMTPPEQTVEITTEEPEKLKVFLDKEIKCNEKISQINGYQRIEGAKPTVKKPKKIERSKKNSEKAEIGEDAFEELKKIYDIRFTGELTIKKRN